MYLPIEIARFTMSEFKRNLEGLEEQEAQARLDKAGGGQMNAISWAVAHIAQHWASRTQQMKSFTFQSGDPRPPSLAQARSWLKEAIEFTEGWLPEADDAVLLSKPDQLHGATTGTGVMRAALHTWFHCGEINAVRQLLGHPEIAFLGDITEHLEWRPGGMGGYPPQNLARFAISEFERGLGGLTADEAIKQLPKTGGGQMNSITWTIGHISTGWLFDYALMTRERVDFGNRAFFGAGADPKPPSLEEILPMWERARRLTETWLPIASDELLSSKRSFGPQADENLGTQLMRAVLHTWFHTGEINAIRQLLGHPEIDFVGDMRGRLEYGGVG